MEQDKFRKWVVQFGPRRMLEQPLVAHCILVVPSRDNWNDFGSYSRVDLVIAGVEGDVILRLKAMIGFLDREAAAYNGSVLLDAIVKSRDSAASKDELPMFFTMLPTMDSYRSIVAALGPDEAKSVLLELNDLVAVNEVQKSPAWLSRALGTEIFALSFVRDAEAFFAFKNAGSLLSGLEFEELDYMSPSLRIAFNLGPNRCYDIRFEFNHDNALPKRIAVLIGKNGVGKSQILRRIVQSSIRGSAELTDGEGRRPLISRLLAFAPTNEAAAVFPPHQGRRNRIWYRRHSLNRSPSSRAEGGTSDVIIQVARSAETIAGSSKWDIFLESVASIRDFDAISLVMRNSRETVPLKSLMRLGEQHRLELFSKVDLRRDPVRVVASRAFSLSSGELSFLKFAAQASLNVENGSLLLLDEPETHLHPNFISNFVSLLNKLLSRTGSAAIIATHSSYFVREVFREQVFVISTDEEGGVAVQRPALRTFGADVGSISYFVFGEDEPSDLAKEVEDRIVALKLPWIEVYDRFKDELSSEILSALRARLEGDV